MEYISHENRKDICQNVFRVKFKRSNEINLKYQEDQKIEEILRGGIEVDDSGSLVEFNLVGCITPQKSLLLFAQIV